jgi:16S rRNA (uracil1498-N3)-methyltransferase
VAHVPRVLRARPWPDGAIPLDDARAHHLTRVLRLRPGSAIEYTDGAGIEGTGTLGEGAVVIRGPESPVAAPAPSLTIAVAPPHRAERARFVVEKLAELGVDRLCWLETRHGVDRPPPAGKTRRWAEAALEQSRGAWLMAVEGPVALADLDARTLWVADPAGGAPPVAGDALSVAVGPEGGWAPGEIPARARLVAFGDRVLRTETAAVVAATIALARSGRL